ncbi:MAG TPA: nucleotidyltransferase family protein, partial [Polyangiaceae bacterium]
AMEGGALVARRGAGVMTRGMVAAGRDEQQRATERTDELPAKRSERKRHGLGAPGGRNSEGCTTWEEPFAWYKKYDMDRDTALTILRAHFGELRTLGARSLSLFGSVARNGATERSDVDLLIDFDPPATFDAFMEAKDKLESWLGRRVDLVTRKALRPRLRQAIEAEAVLVA